MGISLLTDHPFAPQANRDIIRRLQEIDPNLGFKYCPIQGGCWAITEKWGADDPRRSRIQSGDMPPNADFDVLGFAPPDATAEDALDILLKQLRGKVKDVPEYHAMLARCIAANSAVQKANLSQTKDFAGELFSANEEKIGNKIISRGAGFEIVNGKVIGTPVTQKQGLTKSEKEAKIILSDK